MIKRDLLIGLGTTLFGLIGLLVLIPNWIVVPQSIDVLALSPAFWRRILMGMLMMTGLAVTVPALLAMRRKPARAAEDSNDESIKQWSKLCCAIALISTYYHLIDWVGILLSRSWPLLV